jgi:hypothetical protein
MILQAVSLEKLKIPFFLLQIHWLNSLRRPRLKTTSFTFLKKEKEKKNLFFVFKKEFFKNNYENWRCSLYLKYISIPMLS